MIDNETKNLIDQPQLKKYDYTMSAITGEYEVITTFMKIHNISATWEPAPDWYLDTSNSSHQLIVGPYLCVEGDVLECCPSM